MAEIEKVISNLELIKSAIEWEEPLDFQIMLDEAIQTIRELQEQNKALWKAKEELNKFNAFCEERNNDVCEWKSPPFIFEDGNEIFEVGCNKNPLKYKSIPNNFSFMHFKYCPYCGRKIRWLSDGRDK